MFVSPERHRSYIKFDEDMLVMLYDVNEYDELYDGKQCYGELVS